MAMALAAVEVAEGAWKARLFTVSLLHLEQAQTIVHILTQTLVETLLETLGLLAMVLVVATLREAVHRQARKKMMKK